MDILVSTTAAPRLAGRLDPTDRLLRMDPDGTVRTGGDGGGGGGRTVPPGETAVAVAWLTPDVLLDPEIRPRFLDFLLGADTVGWVQSAAAGTDVSAFCTLMEHGARVSNAHVNAIPISEYVLASVLDHFQGADRRRGAQRDHLWRQEEYREVYATTWLVIGLGNIGSQVAIRARAFGATVLGVRRTPTGKEPVDEMLALDDLAGHIRRADVIVLSVPGTSATRHLVDAAFLEQVGSGVVLVNVARGSVVDEAALLASLDHGHPELAVLDTVAREPLPPESPLWSHERVRITCHTAALGTGRLERGTELFLENLRRFRTGQGLINELSMADVSDREGGGPGPGAS